MKPNLLRLIQMAETFFDVTHDPEQLSVDETVLARLKALHPATTGEAGDGEGPYAWSLVIPTSRSLMEAFLAGAISERQLFEQTAPGGPFQAIYLCSALVLPERQRKSLARSMLGASVGAIRAEHPVAALFYWPFSPAGESLAEAVAADAGLPLFRRERAHPAP